MDETRQRVVNDLLSQGRENNCPTVLCRSVVSDAKDNESSEFLSVVEDVPYT